MKCSELYTGVVVPVTVRPVYWQAEPPGMFQALPTDGFEAFYDVVKGIRQLPPLLFSRVTLWFTSRAQIRI
jgi:hypothetical protein